MSKRDDRFLGEALQATLENAVRAPFYRERYGARWRRVKTLDDLARLPILDKATAIQHQRQLIVGRPPPGFGVASSGTTRNSPDQAPLNVVTSEAELEAMNASAPAYEPADDPHPGWTLVSVSVKHGLPGGPPGPGELFLPWMHHPNALHMMHAVLSRPQPDGRRVTAMRISVGALKCLTAWCLEHGKGPAHYGVRLIGTNSFHLSSHWRDLIERSFEAEVIDNYSLSEFSTPVSECKACGWHHFGWPPIIYEVLDLKSGRRIGKGTGRLLLTGVYPYAQKMPLIRYDTGDVLELGPRCRETGQRGVRFLGRLRRGLVVADGDRGAFALAPVHVQDVLEGLPEAERAAHPLQTLGFVRSRDIGLPRWTVELKRRPRPLARLAFEVRFDPDVFPERALELARHVRDEMLRRDPALRRLRRRRLLSLEVRVAPAGTLAPPADKA